MSTPAAQAALKEAILSRIMGADRGLYILPYFIGLWLDSLLMGLVVAQLVTYWQFVRKDKKHIVAAVAVVGVLTVAASVIILCWTLSLYVWGFGTYSNFSEVKWLIRYTSIEIATIAVVQVHSDLFSLTSQAFYVDRACRLYRHWWPAALMGPCILTTVVLGGLALTYIGKTYESSNTEAEDDIRPQAFAYSWLAFILATDTLITATIAYGLYRIKTGLASTDTRIRRVLVRVFESQIPALLCSAISLITWSRKFEVVLAILMVQSKVFAMGLLITLNLRAGSTAASDHNVSYPAAMTSAHGISRLSSYPMDEQPQAGTDHATLHRREWQSSAPKDPMDVELAHPDDYSSGLDEREWASTTGLNRIAPRVWEAPR